MEWTKSEKPYDSGKSSEGDREPMASKLESEAEKDVWAGEVTISRCGIVQEGSVPALVQFKRHIAIFNGLSRTFKHLRLVQSQQTDGGDPQRRVRA